MLENLPDTQTLALLLVAGAIAGYVRGFAGFGSGLLFMPFASALIGPQMAVAVFFIVDQVLSLPLIPNAFKKAHWPTVAPMAIFAVLAAPLGTWTLLNADVILLRWSVCVLILLMLVLLMSGWRYKGDPKFYLSAMVGVVAGFLAGLTQTAGPPTVTYWMSGPLKSPVVRANLIALFAITGISSGLAFYFGGVFTMKAAGIITLLLPVYAITLYAGAKGFVGANESLFRRAVYVLVAISAIVSMPALDGILRAAN